MILVSIHVVLLEIQGLITGIPIVGLTELSSYNILYGTCHISLNYPYAPVVKLVMGIEASLIIQDYVTCKYREVCFFYEDS